MRVATALSLSLAFLAAGCISVHGGVTVRDPHDDGRILRHIVMVKFREGVSPGQIREVEDAARNLPRAIDEIEAFEWGVEISARDLNKGFTHAMLFTFDSEADRDAYRFHPAHEAFVARMNPHVEEIFVFDYWARD